MRCPACNRPHSAGRVIDSRPYRRANTIHRRRVCACGFRYSTTETIIAPPDGFIDVERSAGLILGIRNRPPARFTCSDAGPGGFPRDPKYSGPRRT